MSYQPPPNDDHTTYTPPQQYTQYPPPFVPPPPPYMQPPPKRKRRIWPWIIGGIVALVVISAALGNQNNQQPTSSASPTATEQLTTPFTNNTPVPTQVPTSSTNSIGQPVVVNADWTVTFNKVSKSTGTEFDMPKAGNIYLVVNVTLQNTSASAQNVSSLAQWSLKDESGQTYTQDIAYGNGPDGTVAANGKIRGSIAYEVPKSIHSFILQFVANIGSTDLAEWNVSI